MKIEYQLGIVLVLFSILLYLISGPYVAGILIIILIIFFVFIYFLDRKGILPKN